MHLRRTQKKKAIDLFTVSDTIFVRGRGGGGVGTTTAKIMVNV